MPDSFFEAGMAWLYFWGGVFIYEAVRFATDEVGRKLNRFDVIMIASWPIAVPLLWIVWNHAQGKDT